MKFAYRLAASLLRIFPARWNNKDTQGAVLAFIAVSLLIAALWRIAPWFASFL
jgi:hypothetical protein